MIDFKLTDITGDLDLSNGDLKLVEGLLPVAQVIGTRFKFQKGEWFLDRRVGSPIFDDGSGQPFIIGAKRRDLEQVRAICQQILEGTPGVTKVNKLDLDLDTNRALSVVWEVQVANGDIVTGAETLIFGED